jgi:hypothetical protein
MISEIRNNYHHYIKDKSSEKNNGAVMKALKVKKPKKGRAKGAKNYDKEKLLSAVKAVMPVKMRDWDEVLLVYQTTAKEKVEGRTADTDKAIDGTLVGRVTCNP